MIVISTSKIKTYKACKRAYYFRYVEELETTDKIEPLEKGKSYHAMLEELYKNGDFEIDFENPKVSAMATAYKKYIYPNFKCHRPEQRFEYQVTKGIRLVGIYDGIADDGGLVEHKTTSSDVDEDYEYNLNFDEQTLNYMLSANVNFVYYTVCKKPTIRLKQNETNEQFYQRCVEWFEEDTDKKIKLLHLRRSANEIAQQRENLKYIANCIKSDEKKGEKAFYRNCGNCTAYGRRCEFSSICLNYDTKLTYVGFKKRESLFKGEETK